MTPHERLQQLTTEEAARHRLNLNDLIIHWLATRADDERTKEILQTHAELNDLLREVFD